MVKRSISDTITASKKARGNAKEAIDRLVKKSIQKYSEAKEYTTGNINTSMAGGLVLPINQIAASASANGRVGNSIKGKYVRLKIWLNCPSTAGAIDICQLGLVWDKQANTAVPTLATIYDLSVAGTTGGMCFKETLKNANRFELLATKNIVSGDRSTQGQHCFWEVYVPLKGRITQYNDSSGAVPNTGALFLTAATQNGGTGILNFGLNWNSKFVFTDA